MTAQLNKILIATLLVILPLFIIAGVVSAAAPDGNGPWADTVLSASQGLMKNGDPVPPTRSDPTAALGVAEDDTVEGHFYSLGFGGSIALGFDNGISSGSMVVEATNPGYPDETAKVEMSQDGVTWYPAGNVVADGTVSKPENLTCAKYVRITDTSDPANFSDPTADGYDVDGVKATGDPCTVPTPTPTITPTITPTPTPPSACSTCCSGTSIVNQSNTTVANTTIITGSNTGGNKSSGNTGGSNNINTGSTNTSTNVSVIGGNNINVNNGACCPAGSGTGGSTNVNISGNGAGSKNKVIINAKPTPTPKIQISTKKH
ncbi:MAG TPA: hypothetical protein VG965_03510 [Patescibacteria group bacterium]|nr:hypothetical protein [Patescibacteria group bacterium]